MHGPVNIKKKAILFPVKQRNKIFWDVYVVTIYS